MQKKIINAKTNSLSQANKLVRDRKYEEALALYEWVLSLYPSLHKVIIPNIDYVKRKISKAGSQVNHKVKLECPITLEKYFFDMIEESGLFDPVWYLSEYGKKYKIEENPLAHYLDFGVKNGLNPSTQFDTNYYLKSNPDIVSAGINPFIHYTSQGRKENRSPLPPSQPDFEFNYSIETPKYVQRLALDAPPVEKSVRVIAFYLPQFHPISENDAWWGKGFTEWTNVRPAKPQFEGHYQPHVPDDYLGYYDLRDTSIMHKQIELAKQYGIEGFCFYTYWFTGHRLLETPVDNYLSDASLDHPFCICWANENWSRRWDGLDQDLLMVQRYSDEDDIAFISHMSKYLRDPRYIRVEGKPLLIIYRPNLFPSMKETAGRWRDWCLNNGLGEIHLAYVQSFEKCDPADYGFDVAIEFPPNNSSPPDITQNAVSSSTGFSGKVYDWRVFLQRSENFDPPNYPLFRGACPSWDNTARKKERGTIFANSSPKLFERWLVSAFEDTLHRTAEFDQSLVFINAWNEWAEGAHLEPDTRYGYAWLQAVRDAHAISMSKKRRVLIVSHDAHPHGAQILCLNFAKYLSQYFGFEVDMIVLGEGIMIEKFSQFSKVHRLDLDNNSLEKIDELLLSIKRKGCNIAIVNTTVSGKLIPYLKKQDFNVISLVHELPGILQSYNLLEHAGLIASGADKVVFPALMVKQGFELFIDQSIPQAVIRPQGLYLPSLLHSPGISKLDVRRDVRKKLGLPDQSYIIMCAGYADKRKGFDLFIEACVEVIKRVPNTYALWVGHHDDDFVQQVMKLVDVENLGNHFILTGLVDQPQEYYLAADVYALTSREDPFPSVVMESLDALTPVVAFKGAGGFENLLNRECGILVSMEDTEMYAQALIELLSNSKEASRLARNGQRIIEAEFSFRHYLFDLLEFAEQPLQKVSVVVPNYNYDRYIKKRLETILNQTYPIYELIILDDSSSDNSVNLIKEVLKFTEVPFRFIVNEKNSGSVFKQWNKGVELASGDLVWIAEADDLAKSEFIESLMVFFDNHKTVLAFCQSKQIDENDILLANDYLSYTDDVGDFWRQNYVIDGELEIKRALCIKNTIPNVSAVVFRRLTLKEVLSENLPEIIEYKVAGDWVLYLKMAVKGEIAFNYHSYNMHRRHIHSVTKRHNHYEEVLRVQNIAKKITNVDSTVEQKMSEYLYKLKKLFSDNL